MLSLAVEQQAFCLNLIVVKFECLEFKRINVYQGAFYYY